MAKAAIERAGESSWEAADAFLELSARGWTQQRIGAACGVSQSSVSRFVSCARRYAVTHIRPPFWEAYREVDGHDPAPAPPGEDGPLDDDDKPAPPGDGDGDGPVTMSPARRLRQLRLEQVKVVRRECEDVTRRVVGALRLADDRERSEALTEAAIKVIALAELLRECARTEDGDEE